MRYLKVCRHLSEDPTAWDESNWQQDLDDQALQKLLPKLHGSTGRIGDLLAKLAYYCEKGIQPTAPVTLKSVADMHAEHAKFPKSLRKLKSMTSTLLDEQFVSFVH